MTLDAVFQWVLSATVAGSVAAALVLLVKALARNRFSAGWHYLIWFIVIFRLLMPYSFGNAGLAGAADSVVKLAGLAEHRALNALLPGATGQAPIDQQTGLSGSNSGESNPDDAQAPAAAGQASSSAAPTTPLPLNMNALALIWLAGVVVTGGAILISYRRLMVRVRREPRCGDPELLAIVAEARAALNIRAEIPVILDTTVNSPAFVGLFTPRLLMPAGLPANLTREAKRHIVLHELSHFRRNDILVNWLCAALQALHWFNPLIWHAFGVMRQDCEVACDATALAHIAPDERRGYGQTIIDLLQLLSRPVAFPGTTHIASKTGIKRRMAMIAKSSKKRNPWSVAAVVVTVVVVVTGVAVTGARAFAPGWLKPASAVTTGQSTIENQGQNAGANGAQGNSPVTSGVPGVLTANAYTKDYIAAKLAGESGTHHVTWSPDNTQVAFIRDGGQDFPTGYVWKVGDAEAKSLGEVSAVTHGFIWAPDSKHFLISERQGGPSVLATVVNASDLSRDAIQIHSVTQPIWGPDSKRIAAGCEEFDQQGNYWTTLQVFTIGQTGSTQLAKLAETGSPIAATSWTGPIITYTISDSDGNQLTKTVEVGK